MTQASPRRPITRRRLILLTAGSVAVPSITASPQEETAGMLRDRARARGRLPVLVGLRMPPDSSATDPTAEVARLRAVLFADLGIVPTERGVLAGPGITNVKPFASIPFLALTVDPAALERLLRHPLVASVVEDTAVPPASGGAS
jgi:hypothetical protein